MQAIKNLIGWLVPGKETRKDLRNRLIKAKERRKSLLAYGCRIEGDIAISRDNIHFDISDHAKIAAHIGEILVDEVYSFDCTGDAIVIDIGMNRGIASLYFAAKDNILNVYAFEPFGPTRALAQRNLELNPELARKIFEIPGKLHRVNADGSLPDDNPWPRASAFCLGCRNSFDFTFRPSEVPVVVYASENGPIDNDEINRIVAGQDYGWPLASGVTQDEIYIDPIYTWSPTRAPVGIAYWLNQGLAGAILGLRSDTFYVEDINTETLRFAEAAIKVVGKKDPHTLCSYEDVNDDWIDDLVCHYLTADIAAIDGESTSATVNGELLDGTAIEGSDSINIVKDTCN